MKFHPAAEQYPLMPESELAYIIADMKEHGFDPRFPIARLKGMIVDGRNRYIAAGRAGVEPIYIDLPDDTDTEQYVERANEHRRHLAEDWLTQHRRERMERIAKARQEGKSTRQIAEDEKISQTQVLRDLDLAGEPGDGSPEPETVAGKDGKTYPAAKPAKPLCHVCARLDRTGKPRPKSCADCKALRDDKPAASEAAWVDGWGIPITKEAEKAFKDQPKFDELLKLLRQAKKLFKELAESPGGVFLQQPFVSRNTRDGFIHNGLDTCILNVTDCRPTYTVCPYAYADGKHGKDCSLCRGLGWIGQVSKTNGPPQSLIEKAKKAHGAV